MWGETGGRERRKDSQPANADSPMEVSAVGSDRPFNGAVRKHGITDIQS